MSILNKIKLFCIICLLIISKSTLTFAEKQYYYSSVEKVDSSFNDLTYSQNKDTLLQDNSKSKINNYNNKLYKAVKRDWSKWHPSPKKALWLSIVFPGAGQIYNRKYWKIPIFYGGLTGCIYAMIWNNQMYKDYSRAYMDIMDNDPNTNSFNEFLHLGRKVTEANKSYYQNVFKSRKDKYRRWRDLSIFSTIAVYLLSVIDAYVDASLSEFDISKDLTLRIFPTTINDNKNPYYKPYTSNILMGTGIGVGCNITF